MDVEQIQESRERVAYKVRSKKKAKDHYYLVSKIPVYNIWSITTNTGGVSTPLSGMWQTYRGAIDAIEAYEASLKRPSTKRVYEDNHG